MPQNSHSFDFSKKFEPPLFDVEGRYMGDLISTEFRYTAIRNEGKRSEKTFEGNGCFTGSEIADIPTLIEFLKRNDARDSTRPHTIRFIRIEITSTHRARFTYRDCFVGPLMPTTLS